MDASHSDWPSVTVVVPNRNHARYLPESLGSIAAQTHDADEVIIVDDGSTDESLAVIEGFLQNRPTWRVIRHDESRGVIAALNRGMAEAKGDWIAFLGADDLVAAEFLEKTLAQTRRMPDAALMCGCAGLLNGAASRSIRPVILPTTESEFVSAEQFRSLLRTGDNFFVGTVVLYRRQALMTLGGFDPALGSMCDGLVARRLAARFGFGFIPEILGYWRMHGENYSVVTAGSIEKVERIVARAREVIAAEPPGVFPPGYEHAFDRRVRFGCARLLAFDHSATPGDRVGIVAALLRAKPGESMILRAMMACGLVGSLTTVAWLSLRLRPFSLVRLGLEPLRRRVVLGLLLDGGAPGVR